MPTSNLPAVQFEEFRATDFSSYHLNVILGALAKDDPEDRLRTLPMTVAGVSEEFVAIAAKEQNKLDYTTHNLRLLPITMNMKKDPHEVEYVEWANDPVLSPRISRLLEKASSAASIDAYNPSRDEEFINDLKFYMLTFESPNKSNRVLFFRTFTKTKELKHSNKWIIYFGGDVFSRIEDTAFILDPFVDCVVYKSHMYIFRKSDFAHIFGYYEAVKSLVQANVAKVLQGLPINVLNADILEAACQGHHQKAVKLQEAIANGAFQRFSRESVQETIRKHGLQIRMVNGTIEVNNEGIWDILKLLADDYLVSPNSGYDYDAGNKRKVE